MAELISSHNNLIAAITATELSDFSMFSICFSLYDKTTKALPGKVDTIHNVALLGGNVLVHYTCLYEKTCNHALTAHSDNIQYSVVCML